MSTARMIAAARKQFNDAMRAKYGPMFRAITAITGKK